MSVADLTSLTERFRLSGPARGQLEVLAERLSSDPLAPTTVRDPERVRDDHLADALTGLERDEIRGATRLLDLGAGAGVPGLPLAVALPQLEVTLVDSSSRKCAFMHEVATAMGLSNVVVRHARAEELSEREAWDVVTARALAPLNVLAEYAAPLLIRGGHLVAWRGVPQPEVEAEARRAGDLLGLSGPIVQQVWPYPAAEGRYLYVMSKLSDTPARFPRRAGMARKRPLGA